MLLRDLRVVGPSSVTDRSNTDKIIRMIRAIPNLLGDSGIAKVQN